MRMVLLLALSTASAILAATHASARTPPAEPRQNVQITAAELQAKLAPHPRMILTPQREAELREKISSTPWAKELAAELRLLADGLIEGRKLEGWRPRQWKLAGTGAVTRISSLALAYRLYGDKKYLDEAERNLLQLAEEIQMEDVRVEYLKRSAVLMGLGIGYDWLHDDLSPETLDAIEQGILHGGTLDLIKGEKYKIPGNNWTTVCYGGTAVAALAIAERQPELAAKAVTKAAQLLPTVTQRYQPDGISFEGPHYWDFPTVYHAILTDALRSSLGDDYGLATSPGLRESFTWRIAARGPSGDDFAYGEGERVN